MFNAIVLWLHILGAVVFIGPQVFLAAVAIPALRTIQDVRERLRVTSAITRGFGMVGGAALALVVITGFWNLHEAQDNNYTDIKRYFFTLQVKLLLVVVVIILTALHAMVFGRRLLRLQEENAGEAQIAAARRASMIASIATLVVSLAILLCAAILGSDWSKMGGLR